MSHQLDLDGVLEKLILLQHLAHGSEQYCRQRLIGSEQDVGDEEFDEYWAWVKSIVSIYTLECSIRVRVLLDTIGRKAEEEIVTKLKATPSAGMEIGQVIEGTFDLSLRETYNKIIHATGVMPVWTTGFADEIEFKYWSGRFEFGGTKDSKKWRLRLHIAPWARSVEQFIVEADKAEATMYVGQDG